MMKYLAPALLSVLLTSCSLFSLWWPDKSGSKDQSRNYGDRSYSIGMNTGVPADWSTDKPFADAMRSHRFWEKADQGGYDNAERDADGWPTEDALCLVWADVGSKNNHGTYALSFTGSAVLSFQPSGQMTLENQVYNEAANRTTARLVVHDPDNEGLTLWFRETAGGVKDVKLMRPLFPGSSQSHNESETFSRQYLERLEAFTSIRYMGWMGTNGSQEVNWNERTLWTDASQVRNYGIPSWESIIRLANATGTHAWICIPHQVDDHYIEQLALLFRDGQGDTEPLRDDLNLYIEYSNEIWNWSGDFPQTAWVRDQGAAYGHPLNFDGETDDWTLGLRFKAMRTVQISTIFRQVFGDDAMMSRIRPVLTWQSNWNDMTARTLLFIDRYYNRRNPLSDWNDPHPVNYYLYGGGGSGYWNTDEDAVGLTTENIWDNGTWNPVKYQQSLAHDALWANAFGLTYLAYEGDNHPTYSNGDEPLYQEIHWDSRMYSETLEHLRAFSSLYGKDFYFLVLGNVSPAVWGVINNEAAQPLESPQYRAIQTLTGSQPEPISLGTAIPFTRHGAAFDTFDIASPNPEGTGSRTLYGGEQGSYAASYAFTASRSSSVTLQVTYSTTGSAELVVEWEGREVTALSLESTGGSEMTMAPLSLQVTKDRLSSLRLLATTGQVTIHNIAWE